LLVAEAEQKVAAPRHDNGTKAGYESRSVIVIEDVEKSTVEHGVELRAKGRQVKCVPHFETSIKGASRRLLPGQTDGGWGSIDPDRLESSACSQEGVLASSATDVEHSASDLASVD
jgi:hypothetical protein